MKKNNILGINIANIEKKSILNEVDFANRQAGQKFIVTPNPEIMLMAMKDEEFFYILNKADIAIPDGFGLIIAGWFMGACLKRITGSDLTVDILRNAEKNKKRVAIINWDKGLSKKSAIQESLYKIFPKLNFRVFSSDRNLANFTGQELKDFSPEILIVGLGAPWQEKAVFKLLKEYKSIKLGIGVGGTFDFLTNKIKRSPKIFKILGLEWIWRFLQQPNKRFKRIFNAVIVFPWKFFVWRFILPFCYRPNVACLLFKRKSKEISVLLVERQDAPGHWQLPQGGLGGLSLSQAGQKELKEELAIRSFTSVDSFENLYKYTYKNWSKDISRRGSIYKKYAGYKGQKQGLYIAEFTGRDSEIKINFWDHRDWRWVKKEDVINMVHNYRKESTGIYLDKLNKLICHPGAAKRAQRKCTPGAFPAGHPWG
ncbi:WecB/TagA/CpsF family glycosyltransferase [bacterium]|nr:WecB/TagA/CpsF family glycosyltransferase [bacterium]